MLTAPSEAVNVTVAAVADGAMVRLNVALVAPAATLTEDGSETAVLLALRETPSPPVGAALVRPTVHESVPAGSTEGRLHEILLRVGAGAAAVT